MKKPLFAGSLLALTALASFWAQSANAEATKSEAKNTYLIETQHTGPECVKALDDMQSKNLLGKTEWGCMSGDHRGWTTIQAASKEAALTQVPESQRANAKVIEVAKFTPAQLQAIHAKK
jgi:hypothetical protein